MAHVPPRPHRAPLRRSLDAQAHRQNHRPLRPSPKTFRAKKIAIEINELAHVPDENFIKRAKQAGLKFTFGTDSRNQNAAHFHYCYQMAEKCGLTEGDMFV